MEVPQTSPPRPKPRVRRSPQGYTPSHLPQTTPLYLSQATPSHFIRPGVLVEAKQPFTANNNVEMLKWIFEQKLGGNEQVGEVTVSHDKSRATVEFSHPEILQQLLPKCADLRDPISNQPLSLTQIDIATICLQVTGHPPFVDELTLKDHFEKESNGQQICHVEVSENREIATISFVRPTVAVLFSTKTELFGVNVRLELSYSSLPGTAAQPTETAHVPVTTLCVQGLPENMLNNPAYLSTALEWYFKQTTGFEVSQCTIEHGAGFLTFTDASAVQAIHTSPPTKTFMSGSVLHMSAVSEPPTDLPQVPPSAPREAWGASDPLATTDGKIPVLPAPVNEGNPYVQPVPHQRYFSNGADQRSPPRMAGSQWLHQEDPPSNHPWQPKPSYHSGTQHSPPTPKMMTTPLPYVQQQVSYPADGYPPNSYSGQLQWGQNTRMQPLSVGQQVPNKAAHVPPSVPTVAGGYSKIQVTISDLPKAAKNQSVLRLHFRSLLRQVSSVELFGDTAIITLETPINWEHLLQLSNSNPLEGVVLPLSPLEPSETILVTGLNDMASDILLKLVLADCINEKDPVKSVTRLSPTRALVSFKIQQSAQKLVIVSSVETEGLKLSLKEHYAFMDTSEPDSPSSSNQDGQPSQQEEVQEALSPQRYELSKGERYYLKNTLSELNTSLAPLKAFAEVEDSDLKCFVVISPIQGSASIDDWTDKVTTAQTEHFKDLSVETISFASKEAKADIQDLLYNHPVGLIERHKDRFVIAGSKDVVDRVCEEASEIGLQYCITTVELDCPQKHVKFLDKFYSEELKAYGKDVHSIRFDPDAGTISVTANPNGHGEVKRKVVKLQNTAEEEILNISSSAQKLLSSRRGAEKLDEILGVLHSQIVYDFEQTQIPDGMQCRICFLAKDKDVLKNIKENVKKYAIVMTIETSVAKIRVCSSEEWRDLISRLCEEHFISVTVVEASQTIIVTGEQLACDGIAEKVKKFLAKHINVEERMNVSNSEWFIIHHNFSKKLKAIQERAKEQVVQIKWPDNNCKDPSLPIVISGEPHLVDHIKEMVSALLRSVCSQKSRITNVPSVEHVLESMKDRLRLLETDEKVKIEINLENENNEAVIGTEGISSRQVCGAVSPGGSHVSICTGDLTQNSQVGVIVNFISSNPNTQDGFLGHLLEFGGPEVTENFEQKVSDSMELKPGVKLTTCQGKLKCSQLVHYVLPPWNNSESAETKEYFVETTLKKVMNDASHWGSVLITPLTSAPFHYPLNVFVKLVLDAVVSLSMSVQVVVYVEEIAHANEFQSAFLTRDCHVHQKIPLEAPLTAAKTDGPTPATIPVAAAVTPRAKTLSNPGSFITLVNGDLLKQQVDVYINSTNTDLKLSNGQVSRLLLNICGDELQKEASEYAPLKWGQVAVTNAKNLKCKKIYHISLPEYKMANSERMFRDTVKQILRVAKSNSVSSIAIPSLGVANLGYPESVSANILFEEVIAFHFQYPNSIQKFVFVIYKKSVFQAFSKEFSQQLSGQTTSQAQAQPSVADVVTPAGLGSTTLSIVQGNLAEEATEIIVNTTTGDMALNKTAVSRAILKMAGDQLQKTCQQYVENGMLLEHGQILITRAFGKLRCKKIIHAHLPPKGSMAASSTHHCQLIEKIVNDCLQKTECEKMTSISFPAFGLGGGGYTVEDIAEPMLKAFQTFGLTHPKCVKSVRVVIYDPDLYEKFNKFYLQFFGRSSSDPTPPPSLWQRFTGSSRKVDNESQELQNGMATAQIPHTSALHSVTSSTVIFTIFASSDEKCKDTATKLRQLVHDKSTTSKIKNLYIEQLIEDDVAEIHQIGQTVGVQVEIVQKIKEIRISGEKSKVLEAERDIEKVLNCIQQSITNLQQFEWKSEEEDGSYEAFPLEASRRLERAFSKKLKTIELTVEGVAVEIDLMQYIETDKTTGKKRKIKRSKESIQEYPPTWKTPWSVKAEAMSMIEVQKGTQEYMDAVKEFEDSLTKYKVNCSIEKVERIENKMEYNKHMAMHKAIRDKHKKEPLVKRLFHGSQQDKLQLIAAQGFNRNFAADVNAAYYGKGVYLAVEATYSAQEKYAAPDANDMQYMLVCRMIVGEYAKGAQEMKTAPPLTADSKMLYDSLVDNVSTPTIFVAMTDAQAYPEYLITFKKLK